MVSGFSGADGTFSLSTTEAIWGSNVPLVIQVGKWRRQVNVSSITPCTTTVITGSDLTRLPRNLSEGDMPQIAVVTGEQDALECVFYKLGVSKSEFTAPTGGGHIHLYYGTEYKYNKGATAPGGSPAEDVLWSTEGTVNSYDAIVLACQTSPETLNATRKSMLFNYVNAGGRFFASHYGYQWILTNNITWMGTATWQTDQNPPALPTTGYINTAFTKGSLLAYWLKGIGASTTLGQLSPLTEVRHDLNAVNGTEAVNWLSVNSTSGIYTPIVYSFNAPVAASLASQLGRVTYADLHIEAVTSGTGLVFPNECSSLQNQDYIAMFLMLDLIGCISSDFT